MVFEGDKIVWRAIFTKAGPVTVRGCLFWKGDFSQQWLRLGIVRISIANQVQGVVQNVDVTAADGWQFSVSGLPETDENGTELKYFVTESTTQYNEDNEPVEPPGVKGYTTTYEKPVYVVDQKSWICDITNETEKVRYIVKKIWKDEDDKANARPESVTVKVSKEPIGGEPVAEAVLNSENNWSTVFTLPKGSDYTVAEDEVKHYQTTYKKVAQSDDVVLTTITNEYLETFTVTIRKEWADPVGISDPVPERPDSVNYVLKRNDSQLYSGSLGTDGNWQVIYPNLPVFDENGEKYRYTVEETPVPEGYQVTVEQNETDTGIELVILNKYNKRNIQFKKIWDKDDQTTHPDVTIYLKRNGERVSGQSKTIHASEAGKWFTFNAPDLEMYDGEGKAIEYNVEEDPIPNGYTCYITGSMGQGFTVRNVLTTQTVDVTVEKEWDTKTGTTLLSDLKKADVFKPVETVTLRESEWQHLFENLPLHHQGRVIQYRMEETVPAGYERPYIIHDGEDIRIENRKREPSPDYPTTLPLPKSGAERHSPASTGTSMTRTGRLSQRILPRRSSVTRSGNTINGLIRM